VGVGEISLAVTDAGPLIHLYEIGCLSLLRVVDRLHAPDAVWLEAIEHGRIPQEEILTLGIVQRHELSPVAVEQFIRRNAMETLHSGERECLFLCRHIGVTVLLTDDLAVRDAAKRLALTPVGSLGVVVRAYWQERISLTDAERHILALYEVSSLFVTQTIVELAIQQLRQHSQK
jgi:predicted nucleic acid-binding protein